MQSPLNNNELPPPLSPTIAAKESYIRMTNNNRNRRQQRHLHFTTRGIRNNRKLYLIRKLLKILSNPYTLTMFTFLWMTSNIMLLRRTSTFFKTHDGPWWCTNQKDTIKRNPKSRRKFISYTSSQWEKTWIDNIGTWEKDHSICEEILQQTDELQAFLNATCTARLPYSSKLDWCLHDDTFQPFWINIKTFEHTADMPHEVETYLVEMEEKNKEGKSSAKGEDDGVRKSNRRRRLLQLQELLRNKTNDFADDDMILSSRKNDDTITNKETRGDNALLDDFDARINNGENLQFDDFFREQQQNYDVYFSHNHPLEYMFYQSTPNPPSTPFQIVNLPEDKDGAPFVFSKFVFLDEFTGRTSVEYIEPLVSHLRHPLALCSDAQFYLLKRSFIVPPHLSSIAHPNDTIKKYYFDAGASSWTEGDGGPSLDFFTKIWLRHGIDFDHIEAWEGQASYHDFNYSLPDLYRNRTHFHNKYIVSSIDEHNEANPFVPFVIQQKTKKEDYVLFKLDIDNGEVEVGIVLHLLASSSSTDGDASCNDHIDYIDEFIWEHHVEGNYLLAPYWLDTSVIGTTIEESYQLFLRLRLRGVRAHSWV